MKMANPEYLPALTEIEKQFANEFDYRREAQQLNQVRRNLQAGGFSEVVVPQALEDHCTKSVLTMTEVTDSVRLDKGLKADMEYFARATNKSVQQLMDEEKAKNAAALGRGELRQGVDSTTMERYIWYTQLRNTLLRPLGFKPAQVPLNHAALIDELFRVHGHEIFIDGRPACAPPSAPASGPASAPAWRRPRLCSALCSAAQTLLCSA